MRAQSPRVESAGRTNRALTCRSGNEAGGKVDAFNSDLVPEASKWRATISRTSPQCDEKKRVKEDTMPLLERSHKTLVDGPESHLWTRPLSCSEDTLRQQKGHPERRTALRCPHVVPPKGGWEKLADSVWQKSDTPARSHCTPPISTIGDAHARCEGLKSQLFSTLSHNFFTVRGRSSGRVRVVVDSSVLEGDASYRHVAAACPILTERRSTVAQSLIPSR